MLESNELGRKPDWVSFVAAFWLAAFFVFFYSFTLPNNAEMTRLDIWRQLPIYLLENVAPISTEAAAPSGWRYLPQRFDLAAVAAVILYGAWGLGHLVLRLIKPPLAARCVERTVFAFAVGLSGLSLLTLAFGLAGLLSRPILGGLLLLFGIGECGLRFLFPTGKSEQTAPPEGENSSNAVAAVPGWLPVVCGVTIAPFLLAMLLGAMLPSVDFDVKEYHLQGPKEFYQAGRITMLEHNVYTSFPFLTEMLSLLAMVLRDDWYRGALAGKVVLMCFAPLTGLALYAAGKRWFGPAVGWWAALIFLSTPWIYRISIIAYAEGGLTFFLFAALLAVMLGIEKLPDGQPTNRQFFLAGLLAGSAMACKYPGVLQVVIPLGAAAVAAPFVLKLPKEIRRRRLAGTAAVFAIGVLLTIGPWLVKNTLETGNPVYPLLYSVFGGEDWDAGMDAKWKSAHSPDNHALQDLGEKFIDVTVKSDWLSPLLFGLAPLALLNVRKRRTARSLWLYVGFLFFAWWLFTHRIDRFWVPMIPVVSLLAAVGASFRSDIVWKCCVGGMTASAILFNLAYITTPWCGYNAYLIDMKTAREQSQTRGMAALHQALLKQMPPGATVLCVGEAEVFDARLPVVYNTVFDRSLFEELCAAEQQDDLPAGEKKMRSPEDIRRHLHDAGITHIFVNWDEILRYRLTYGYTDFVAPGRFADLRRGRVLGTPQSLASVSDANLSDETRQRLLQQLNVRVTSIHRERSKQQLQEIEQWGPSLSVSWEGADLFLWGQLFPVRP